MLQWIRSEHTDYCNKLQNYYYNKALNLENNRNYLYLLQKCYAKECKGIAVKYFKGMSISFWAIGEYFKDFLNMNKTHLAIKKRTTTSDCSFSSLFIKKTPLNK